MAAATRRATRWLVVLVALVVGAGVAVSYAASAGALGSSGPGEATVTTLQQGIQLEILGPGGSTTSTTAPPRSTTTTTAPARPPVVGGLVVTPLDPGSNRGAPPAAEPSVRAGELVRTGTSSTLVLTVVGLALLDVGWLARSAVPAHLRRRRAAGAATTPGGCAC